MKRFLACILSLAMILSLAACGGKEEAPAETPAAPSETPAETPAESAGDVIRIGVYTPMTTSNAASGLDGLEGMQMAVDEVNAAGGIDGRMMELIPYDCTGTSEGATKAATRLIEEDGVHIIAGSFLSPSILAVSEITEKAGVLHVGTGTGATWTNIGLEYTYRATTNGNLPIETLVDQVVDCGFKSVALISVASDYGQSGHDAIVASCDAKGVEIKADIVYQSADTDFTGHISQALSSGAETFVLYGLGQELALIVKQLRQNGYTDLIFTGEGGDDAEMFAVAGSSANGIVYSAAYVIPSTPEEGATDLMKSVLKRYYDKKGEMPYSEIYYRGYDQMMLIAEALKNAEDPDSGESVKDAFKAISGVELLGGSFDYTDGSGDGLTSASKWMILDDKIQVYDKDALMAFRG